MHLFHDALVSFAERWDISMKLKYYLRGLGIGIILTVIILAIASSGKEETLSDEEIIERAETMGMIMEEETEKNGLPVEEGPKEELVEPEQSEGPKEEEAVEPEQSEEPKEEEPVEPEQSEEPKEEEPVEPEQSEEPKEEEPVEPEQSEKPKEEEPVEPEQSEEPETEVSGEVVIVEIIRGEYSDKISVKLLEAGLVADADEFNRYLVESGMDERIAVGKHQIPQGASMEEIARILCEEPLNQ